MSNFAVPDLQELLSIPKVAAPQFIQNWMDPLHQDEELRKFASNNGIQYQAYSSLGTQWLGKLGWNPVMTHPTLKRVAADHAASVPRVVLAWALQRGATAIPASRLEAHIRELFQPPPPSPPQPPHDGDADGDDSRRDVYGLQLVLSEEALVAIDALDGTLCNGDVWQCKGDEQPFEP